MKLVSLDGPRLGAIVGADVLDLTSAPQAPSGWGPRSVLELIEAGDEALAVARQLIRAAEDSGESLRSQGLLTPLSQASLVAPISRPNMVFSAGNNYSSHSREMGVPRPSRPTGFIKSNACITGPGSPIVLPEEAPDMVDYEGEFALVFGRKAYRVSEAEALGYVAGYMCSNDVSAREWVDDFLAFVQDAGAAPRYEAFADPGHMNLLYKQFPTFLPTGPCVVTADEIRDPEYLSIRTIVNGETRQDSNTSDLTFKLPQLIAYWSRFFAFEPGDIMTTGSPPGVGFAHKPPVFLKAGDEVAVEIEHVGRLINPVARGT